MLGGIAVLGAMGAMSARFKGCAEDRVKPPKPTCSLEVPTSPRSVVADLVRRDSQWLLARDDDDGALVMSASTSVFVFPATEKHDPAAALAAFAAKLPSDVRTALHRTQLMLVWLGRAHDTRAGGMRYPAWDNVLDVQLFHDVLTPNGCLVRVAPFDDPELHVSRHRANERARHMAAIDSALVRGLRDGSGTPLSPNESAARMRTAAPKLREVAMVSLRESYAPVSVLVIVALILGFYWWAASAGKDSVLELSNNELAGDGALIVPGRFDVRVLSHGLLHADLKHLLNNIIALWIGCVILEPAIGSARTLIVFLAGVIGGGLVRLRARRPGLMIGASGGAFALQAAALVLLLHPGTWFLLGERTDYITFLAIQLAFGLVASFLPGVSMAAHVGGALAGFLLTVTGLLMLGRPPLDGGPESDLSAGIAWCIAGLGVALWIAAGVAVQWGRTDLESADTGASR